MRYKMGGAFSEVINHFADDNGYDLFVPLKEVEPNEDQTIKE